MDKVNKYQELANKFADLIEQNEAPWQKPWSGQGFLPYNIKSEKEYNGMNLFNLMMEAEARGYEDNRWLTFLQASELGAKVRPGEKGMHIMFLQTKENVKEIDEITGEEKIVTVKLEKPRAMWSVVFNAEQCEGLPAYQEKLITFNPIEKAEEILNNSGATIIHKKQNETFYDTVTDTITLPLKEQFKSPEAYYRCALHELGHWTAHEKRNNRDLSGSFSSESYAREELVAEITSFLVGTQCGLGHEPNENNVAYLKSWAKEIRDDPSYLFKAVKDADKAANLILGKELEKIKSNEKKMEDIDNNSIELIDSIALKITKEIKDKLEQEEQAFLTRQYIEIKELFFKDFEAIVYESTGKSIENYGIKFDEAHNMHYLVHNAENTIKDLPNNMERLIEKVTVNHEKYYLDFYINELTRKLGEEKTAALGLMYDEERELYYCKPEERYKFLPYITIYKEIPVQDKHYLDLSEKEAEELFCYSLKYDYQLKKHYVHKDLKHIYEDYLMTTRNQQHHLNNNIRYIDVPIREKEEAKQLGAKWDANNMCWFVPADKDLSLFDKWERIEEKDLIARKEQKQVNMKNEKYILAVPYEEREQAKILGAKWDKDGKFWYCQEAEKEKFFKWDIKNVENKVTSDIPLNIEEEFLNRIKSAGVLENAVIADGQKHRISVDGDKAKEQSGFYVLHADGVANGYFFNNRTGEEIKWNSKENSYNSMTPEEKAEMKALYQARKAEREQEDKILTEKAEKALYAKFMNREAINEHSYLTNKMVEATQNIYAGNDSTITVPLYNVDGRLKSAQYIDADGNKRFAKNTNKVGAFHIVDGNAADLKSATSIIIAEGYATAASINEAVKEPGLKVIAAMSANNLEHTVKAITEKYPAINIVIAADNDIENKVGNIGLNAAKNVSEKYKNVTVAIPKINGKEVAGDFNDIVSKKGLSKEEVFKAIQYSIKLQLKHNKSQEQNKTQNRDIGRAI